MVRLTLTDQDFSLHYRQAGQRAIRERHTYAHRARTVLELLGLAIVPDANASSADE